jgi:hypothetical protein
MFFLYYYKKVYTVNVNNFSNIYKSNQLSIASNHCIRIIRIISYLFPARDGDEREKWIQGLENVILRHSSDHQVIIVKI